VKKTKSSCSVLKDWLVTTPECINRRLTPCDLNPGIAKESRVGRSND
jgi:hypothetical protein